MLLVRMVHFCRIVALRTTEKRLQAPYYNPRLSMTHFSLSKTLTSHQPRNVVKDTLEASTGPFALDMSRICL